MYGCIKKRTGKYRYLFCKKLSWCHLRFFISYTATTPTSIPEVWCLVYLVLFCIINWRADSIVLITLVSLRIVWGSCYHAGIYVELFTNCVDNGYFVIGSSRIRPSPSTSFLKRTLQPGQTLSLSYAVLWAKDRNGTLILWVKSDAQVNLVADVSVFFSPALLGLLLQSEKLSPYLLLGKTVLCAPTCPLTAFDLSLWITIVFLKEEIFYKETRRARGILRLKPQEAGGENIGYTLPMKAEGAWWIPALFAAFPGFTERLSCFIHYSAAKALGLKIVCQRAEEEGTDEVQYPCHYTIE